MTFPKVTDWSETVYNAGARGFNFLVDFNKEMHRVFPDTTPYIFGKFSESDIGSVTVIGWKHLTGDMFGIENIDDWNSKVGLRFGLNRDASDNVKYGDEYVMLMPRGHRDEVILPARKEANVRAEQAAKEAAIYVHPEDPEKNKMRDRAMELSEATSSTRQVKASGTSGPNLGKDAGSGTW
ncbi:hypothetical protein LCGC14_0344990 [marine sediment metagenome]|uniref:Uncharacterized protein n=1 Tax=marine sediment metagenome TaxID=412755 RepID=A0A0F9WKK7_9ZZZZ